MIDTIKKVSLLALLVAFVLLGLYTYFTRPVDAPDEIFGEEYVPSSNETVVYRIGEGTMAKFEMNELLNGKPKLVIGTTTMIVGDIAITGNDIDMGEIKLDARTLITDNEKRNGAINRLILKTGTPGNEYVTFLPRSNTFEGEIIEGEPLSFSVIGDLTISGVTKSVTFDVEMKIEGDVLTGNASAKIKRSDFGIMIPNLPFIADVDDEFPISIDVVAEKVRE